MPTHEAALEFAPAPLSAGAARRFVRDQLRGWGVGVDEDDVALMVSELVTNVGLHARTEAFVRVTLRDGCLRVEVSDHSAVPIQVRPHAPGAETGRGLRIVEALAEDWGVRADDGGKTVWFEVPVHEPAPVERARG